MAVLLHGDEDRVTLEIGDDGTAFDPAGAYPAENGGYGLAGLRTRVEQVNGSVAVRSAPGEGTTIRVEVPYQ
ncbi:sensor histidine kinase [Micromonospora craniellae]|uniref:sensor histidine kinase n=1 Tax=Micromonospora craniellae TaxID=2294034 RepID=UPI001F3F747D|nr:ATP-binding protein [Micromonospora craniellae]